MTSCLNGVLMLKCWVQGPGCVSCSTNSWWGRLQAPPLSFTLCFEAFHSFLSFGWTSWMLHLGSSMAASAVTLTDSRLSACDSSSEGFQELRCRLCAHVWGVTLIAQHFQHWNDQTHFLQTAPLQLHWKERTQWVFLEFLQQEVERDLFLRRLERPSDLLFHLVGTSLIGFSFRLLLHLNLLLFSSGACSGKRRPLICEWLFPQLKHGA